ncbi:MAG: acyl-CoA dehydrogenase family protein [Chloroflexota bacterium]|nr:acyl-CoA dehydrogenase family protein [Chloroflexota bacterium]
MADLTIDRRGIVTLMPDSSPPGPDFSLSPRQINLQHATAAFIREQVVPREKVLLEPESVSWPVIQDLRQRAREVGVYGPQLPVEYGGLGLDCRTCALLFEEAGTSLLGPLALNCAAPDEGNMHLLERIAPPEQRERFLAPLARGETRSCFAMTEPAPGAGSDPTMLRSTGRREGNDWILEGHKWFITGAYGAAVAIVMVRTSEETDPRLGATLFLVPTDTPGFNLSRVIPSLDHAGFFGGHAELRLDRVRVGEDAVLGEVGRGFEYAQVRLAPARLTHCMRWLGVARRSLEIAAGYANERTSGGRLLGEQGQVQAMLANSAIDLHASRLMIAHAAWVLDSGGPARAETQMAKVFVSEAVGRVVDRAIQICGAFGISDDAPLSLFYREVRPFRIYDGASEVHRAAIARRVLRQAGASVSETR